MNIPLPIARPLNPPWEAPIGGTVVVAAPSRNQLR